MKTSVIIPCRNAGPYLAQTIGSALDQTRPPHEIIVVDDGSTDGSLTLARRFEAYGGVRVFAETSGGAAKTRNVGASIATGDALMFLDADDVLGPHALAALSDALSRRPDGVAACAWRRLDYVNGRWIGGPASCAPRRAGQDALSAWLTGWYYPPCAVLWSREAYARTGGWDEGAALNDDGDLMMRALVAGVPLVETEAGVSFYRRLPEGETSLSGKRFAREGIVGSLAVIAKIARLLEEQDRMDGYRASLEQAFATIAANAGDRHPDLRETALAQARRHAPSIWSRIRSGGRSPAGRRRDRRGNTGSPTREREIRFGIDRAEQALSSAPTARPDHMPDEPRPVPRPAVSIVVPTYNRPQLLRRALVSVLAQTFADFEVLVVDDGQSDETAALVATCADPRLRYLRQPENRGVAAARNRGIGEARGQFVAFLDDDDEWLPAKLARQVALFGRAPAEVGLICTGFETVLADGSRIFGPTPARGDVFKNLLARNVLQGANSSALIRRQIVTDIGFFDEVLPAIEDYDYWLRISRRYRVDCVAEPLVRYYDDRHPTMDTPEDGIRRSRNHAANLRARAEVYRRYGAAMRRAGVAHLYLLDSARRHFAAIPKDIPGARRLAALAVMQAPTSREGLRLLASLLVPPRMQGLVQARHRVLRAIGGS